MAEVVNQFKGKTSAQLEAIRADKAAELNQIFTTHTTTNDEGSKSYDLTVDQLNDVQQRHKELNDLGAELQSQRSIEHIAGEVKGIYEDLSGSKFPRFVHHHAVHDRVRVLAAKFFDCYAAD